MFFRYSYVSNAMPDISIEGIFKFIARDVPSALVVGGIFLIAIGAALDFLGIQNWGVFVLIGLLLAFVGAIVWLIKEQTDQSGVTSWILVSIVILLGAIAANT